LTSEEPARGRALRRAAWAVAALPALALVAAERVVFGDLAGFPLDDAFIHLQFARNLAAGGALAFNPGEPVAGTTAPLWTALVALLSLLPGALAFWAKGAGVAAHLASLVAVDRLARALDLSRGRAAVAVVLVGWTDWLVFASTSGMEIPLFTLVVLEGLRRQIVERRDPARAPSAFLCFALAALARPEALLLVLLAAIDRAVTMSSEGMRVERRDLRAALAGLALAALVLVPIAAVYVVLSGSALPTTLGAKLTLAAAPGTPPVSLLRGVARVVELLFVSQPLPLLLACGGAVELARRLGGARDAGLLLPLWTVAMPLGSALVARGGELPLGNFGRYFFPLLPLVVLLGLVALAPLDFERLRRLRIGRVPLPLGAAALALVLAYPAARSARAVPLALLSRQNVEESDRAAARFLAAHAPASAVIATCDIGVLKYELPNRVVDLAGIAQPELLRHLEHERGLGRAWPQALSSWLESRRPDYVVLYPRWFPLLERESARFPVLARFRIEQNVAMAGEELVVYATPWTREEPTP
jgi:hypothetical protein